jgi:hypothetical protein
MFLLQLAEHRDMAKNENVVIAKNEIWQKTKRKRLKKNQVWFAIERCEVTERVKTPSGRLKLSPHLECLKLSGNT